MAICTADLPRHIDERVIFDLDDGATIAVELRPDGTFYGAADKWDYTGTAPEMVGKLNRWRATLAGWES